MGLTVRRTRAVHGPRSPWHEPSLCVTLSFSGSRFFGFRTTRWCWDTPTPSSAGSERERPALGRAGQAATRSGVTAWHPEDPGWIPFGFLGCGWHRGEQRISISACAVRQARHLTALLHRGSVSSLLCHDPERLDSSRGLILTISSH